MELYFGWLPVENEHESNDKVVTFAIPDIGVKFKAPFKAEEDVIDFVSLLTLLEFISINPQLFTNRALEIFCNNYDLVNILNNGGTADDSLSPVVEKAAAYQEKFNFTINWIPRDENPAQFLRLD